MRRRHAACFHVTPTGRQSGLAGSVRRSAWKIVGIWKEIPRRIDGNGTLCTITIDLLLADPEDAC